VVQPLFAPNAGPLAEALARQRLPSISSLRAFAAGGGLMTYGPSFSDLYKRTATFVDRLLKGARPADLPVEEPTLYNLVLNLRTAQSIGLAIPQSVLLRADEVIRQGTVIDARFTGGDSRFRQECHPSAHGRSETFRWMSLNDPKRL
jgi:hypothetical protein